MRVFGDRSPQLSPIISGGEVVIATAHPLEQEKVVLYLAVDGLFFKASSSSSMSTLESIKSMRLTGHLMDWGECYYSPAPQIPPSHQAMVLTPYQTVPSAWEHPGRALPPSSTKCSHACVACSPAARLLVHKQALHKHHFFFIRVDGSLARILWGISTIISPSSQ